MRLDTFGGVYADLDVLLMSHIDQIRFALKANSMGHIVENVEI